MSGKPCYSQCKRKKEYPFKFYDWGRYYPRYRVMPYLSEPSGYGWPSFKHNPFQPSFTTPYPQFQESDNFARNFSYQNFSGIPMNNWRLLKVLQGDQSNFYPGACVMPSGNCLNRTSRWSCYDLYGGETFVPYAQCGFGI